MGISSSGHAVGAHEETCLLPGGRFHHLPPAMHPSMTIRPIARMQHERMRQGIVLPSRWVCMPAVSLRTARLTGWVGWDFFFEGDLRARGGPREPVPKAREGIGSMPCWGWASPARTRWTA